MRGDPAEIGIQDWTTSPKKENFELNNVFFHISMTIIVLGLELGFDREIWEIYLTTAFIPATLCLSCEVS